MFLRCSALLLAIGSVCLAQDTAARIIERMDHVVEDAAASDSFMGVALVARGDEILLNKGYGSANLEWDIPNTPEVKFRLGSVTKQFTAACILLLEERDKLSVDDLVTEHLPDAPEAWSAITIRGAWAQSPTVSRLS